MATQPEDLTPETTATLQAQAKKTKAKKTKQNFQETGKKAATWPIQAWGEMYRFFEGIFAHDFPAVDIVERDNEVLVYADLPGVHKEDLNVTVGDNSVTIRGSVRREEVEGEFFRREIRRQGAFSRTLNLPMEVDPPQGKAKFRENMLELILPKSTKRHTLQIE